MFACLTIFNSGSENYFGFPSTTSPPAPQSFPRFTFLLMDLAPARVQLRAQYSQNGICATRGYEMRYSPRFHALMLHTTMLRLLQEELSKHGTGSNTCCKLMAPWNWRNDCGVQLFIFIPGKKEEQMGINGLRIHLAERFQTIRATRF